MTPWLTVIGVGADGIAGLAPAARALLAAADIVVGSRRLLAGADLPAREQHEWTSPLDDMLARIAAWRGRPVAVLATGDPMHFGIGCTLASRFPAGEMRVVPAPSAFSLAAARLGWALQETECLSLHGRPVELVVPALAPGARILALTGGAQTVREVAALMTARGLGASRLRVLEHMGGTSERAVALRADEVFGQVFDEFNLLAIECAADAGAALFARVPGLPDEAFRHDGQLTKREVRAITLAALAPWPGELLWDVGAGCGSVAIEWLRAARGGRALAFERDDARRAMIADNAVALGVPHLDVVAGAAPASLAGRAAPDAVFLGGGVADEALFAACWAALRTGGRLVANAVTLEGEAALVSRAAHHGGELVRIDIARLERLGPHRALTPRRSVLQWRAVKRAPS